MQNVINVTFGTADRGVHAAETLLLYSVNAEDIHLILPDRLPIATQNSDFKDTLRETVPGFASGVRGTALNMVPSTLGPFPDFPLPPRLPAVPDLVKPEYYGTDDFMAPASGNYHFDALGAILPDPTDISALPSAPASVPLSQTTLVPGRWISGVGVREGVRNQAVVALPSPSQSGVTDDVFGYLVQRGVAHEIARSISDRVKRGGAGLA